MVKAIFSGVNSAGTMTGCSTGGTCKASHTERDREKAGEVEMRGGMGLGRCRGRRCPPPLTLSEKLSATTEEMREVFPVRAVQRQRHSRGEEDRRSETGVLRSAFTQAGRLRDAATHCPH